MILQLLGYLSEMTLAVVKEQGNSIGLSFQTTTH
jgi:hypothetical protein